MAPDFVGSNNSNLLQPNGTRNQKAKDAASLRYVLTRHCPITRLLRNNDDLVNRFNIDGKNIYHPWYKPIMPVVLVNGTEGIGREGACRSFVPNYNPREIIANLRRLLSGEMMEPMHPWYRGFKGTIEKTASNEAGVTYTVTGVIEEVNERTLRIKELPIFRTWTEDYREFLESLSEQTDSFIEGFREYSDGTTVDFEVFLSEANMMLAKQEGLLKKFKLTATISTSNMYLFDPRLEIKKYDTPEQILEEFFSLKLKYYEKKREAQLENLEMEIVKLENKVKFIDLILNHRLPMLGGGMFIELQKLGFTPFPKNPKPVEVVVDGATDETEGKESSGAVRASDYDYLLSMPLIDTNLDTLYKLKDERVKFQGEVDELRKATPKLLWVKDLDALEKQLDELDQTYARAEEEREKPQSRAKNEADTKVVSRRAPKALRKNDKKADNAKGVAETLGASSTSATETENVTKMVKPKGKTGSKRASVEMLDDDEDEEEVPDLNIRTKRLARLNGQLTATNLESSPDQQSSVVETEVAQVPARKKEPSKRAAVQKGEVITISDTSDSEDEIVMDGDDEDFETEEIVAPGGKKGGRKAVAENAKAARAPSQTKKRGAANKQQPQIVGQKLVMEMLKPAESSPEKKVRKMRASPFNKKSGSKLGRLATAASAGESASPTCENSEEVTKVVPAKPRPQRANRRQPKYVLTRLRERH